jgi:hypothetical protein
MASDGEWQAVESRRLHSAQDAKDWRAEEIGDGYSEEERAQADVTANEAGATPDA